MIVRYLKCIAEYLCPKCQDISHRAFQQGYEVFPRHMVDEITPSVHLHLHVLVSSLERLLVDVKRIVFVVDELHCLAVFRHVNIHIAVVWVPSGLYPYSFKHSLCAAAHVVEIRHEVVVPEPGYVQHSTSSFSTSA